MSSKICQTSLNLYLEISFIGLIVPTREYGKRQKGSAELLTIIVGYVNYNQKPSCVV